jgi:hypothetical protein
MQPEKGHPDKIAPFVIRPHLERRVKILRPRANVARGSVVFIAPALNRQRRHFLQQLGYVVRFL